MAKGHDLLIIIPAHNEEENIQIVFEELKKYAVCDYADVLIVDDASSDKTAVIARENNAHCISFAYNMGYGNALQAGYRYAVRYGYEYVIQMDADCQHDACNLEHIRHELCEVTDKPDIVLACRFMEGSSEYKPGFFKWIAFKWYRMLVKLFGGFASVDSTTGLQGLNRRAFAFYAGYDHFDSNYPDANMILQMVLLGYKLKQIPAVMHLRQHGRSMHSGIYKPVRYMFRSTAAVLAVWIRIRVLKDPVYIMEAKNSSYEKK